MEVWKEVTIQEYRKIASEREFFRSQNENLRIELIAATKENGEKDAEIGKLKSFCQKRNRDLLQVKEWIIGFQPLLSENERRIQQLETTVVELNATIARLQTLVTTLFAALLSQIKKQHWINFIFSYH